jgi:hypothetical protein
MKMGPAGGHFRTKPSTPAVTYKDDNASVRESISHANLIQHIDLHSSGMRSILRLMRIFVPVDARMDSLPGTSGIGQQFSTMN